MKRRWRFRFLISASILFAIAMGITLVLWRSTDNDLDPIVDALVKVPMKDRWSHPEMQKLREMGAKAVPDLRRILRERSSPMVKLLQKAEKRWPKTIQRVANVDDQRLRDRQWVACIAIQVLGPAGRSAAPELIEILQTGELAIMNGATGGLEAIGIDRDICERLASLVEKNALNEHQRAFAIRSISLVKPPSKRMLKVVAHGFADPSIYVHRASAEAAGELGVLDPGLIAGLKLLLANSFDDGVKLKASLALWKLTKDRELVLRPVLACLEARLRQPLDSHPRPGASGQGISHGDQTFMDGAEIFRQMKLEGLEREKARVLLENWGRKAKRIFVEMLLLPAAFELGMEEEKCFRICREGLARPEEYYRIEAARLLAIVSERFNLDEAWITHLLTDADVNVRIYAAKIHWAKHRDPKVATILGEALDRKRHQSYWFEHNLPVAIETLRDMGPAAKEAIPALERATSDPNQKIVTLAMAALVKIRR